MICLLLIMSCESDYTVELVSFWGAIPEDVKEPILLKIDQIAKGRTWVNMSNSQVVYLSWTDSHMLTERQKFLINIIASEYLL